MCHLPIPTGVITIRNCRRILCRHQSRSSGRNRRSRSSRCRSPSSSEVSTSASEESGWESDRKCRRLEPQPTSRTVSLVPSRWISSRRSLSLKSEIGWDVKAMEIWLHLMMAPKISYFPNEAKGTANTSTMGPIAIRHPGVCWLYNTGNRKSAGLCKYKHDCSACGSSQPAAHCTRPSQNNLQSPVYNVMSKTPVKVAELGPWLDNYLNKLGRNSSGFTYGLMIPIILS